MNHFTKRLLFVFAVIIIIISCAPPPKPSPLTPMQPNIAVGGRAVAIAVHPTDENKIVVASESGGLFLSTNKGVIWSQVSKDATIWFKDVVYLPSNPNIIFATADADWRTISGGGIWHSVDSGNTWSRIAVSTPTTDCTNNIGAYALAAETFRDRVWAGTSCGLAYSDDQGLSWQFLPVSTIYNNDKIFAVLAPSAGHLVALTETGVKTSTDDGNSWNLSNSGLPGNIFNSGVHNQIAVSPYNPSHIYRSFNKWYWNSGTSKWEAHISMYLSTDNGSSWNNILDDPGSNRPTFIRIAKSLSGKLDQYDIYFGDGACTLKRATATDDITPAISSWTSLNFDHCDPADLAFSNDQKTPLLLATDGGLHSTSDNGQHWSLIGGGNNGYNALQITEVIGQLHSDSNSADLYFATQDNYIWASPDKGMTWTVNICCEGFYLNIPRDYLPPDQTKLTGVTCGECVNFISGPLLANDTGFPNPPNNSGNPCLLKPGYYIHNTKIAGLSASIFALTPDNGLTWTTRYGFPEETRDLSKISEATNNPIVYIAIKVPGATLDGQEIVQIKRITDILSTGTPLVSNISGFGNLGIFNTMFAWYKPFGVDLNDSNYLIVPDLIDQKVKVSTDAGATWTPDMNLTNLVTQAGLYKFKSGPFSQISTFGFDPDHSGHILVGTQQAGLFETFDKGVTWVKVVGSEVIPRISSFFFSGKNEVIISSYGRGLWKYTFSNPAEKIKFNPVQLYLEGPYIYWKGAKVPISQIHDPDVCPVCGYYLVFGGQILGYKVNSTTGQLTDVFISGGEIRGYSWDGVEIKVPFNVSIGKEPGNLYEDKQIPELLKEGNQIKGLFLDGNILKGLIVYAQDLSLDQLPKKAPLGPHINIEIGRMGESEAGALSPILVTGIGFNPQYPLEVLLDGYILKLDSPVQFDDKGNFTISIPPLVDIGGHTILVRQRSDRGLIQDASTFLITTQDLPGEK